MENIPPLLRLPPELHLNITGRLQIQDLVHLRSACRYLKTTIPAPKHSEFLEAETEPWAISQQLFACKGCCSFRELLQFADDMRKGKRGRRGTEAKTRLCMKCGFAQGLYGVNEDVTIMGQCHRVCSTCTSFRNIAYNKGTCNTCVKSARAENESQNGSSYDQGSYSNEADWACSTNGCEGHGSLGDCYECFNT